MHRITEWLLRPDRLAALVLLAVAGVAIREGAPLREGIMGPGLAPLVAGALLAVLALGLLLWPDRGPTAEGGAAPGRRAPWTFLALVLYVLLLRPLGFALASATFLAALFRFLGRYPLWMVVPAAAASAGLLNVVFRWGLQFPLPVGPWGF
jgi:putative tricarboxylic transport membrane protein